MRNPQTLIHLKITRNKHVFQSNMCEMFCVNRARGFSPKLNVLKTRKRLRGAVERRRLRVRVVQRQAAQAQHRRAKASTRRDVDTRASKTAREA